MTTGNHSLKELQEKIKELEMVFQSSHEEIFVTDANGTCIRVNPACERHYGLSGIELVGKNVYDLVEQKVFYPSATVVVLQEQRPVTLIQSTSTGRRLLVTANPVFDEAGNLIRVVSNSTDVTEILSLKQQVEEKERVIQEYTGQLERLRKSNLGLAGTLIAKSKPMMRVLQVLERVSQVDTNVLLLGESGVGKTEVAYWLHQISNRREGPFIEVNCGAIPPSLFEAELFGYEPGSFSGALSTGRIGLIESANKGTLFLDEIGELPLELQKKLLQVIQNKSFMRVGGRERVQTDVRFITATNQDLEKMLEEGTFRLDLYYRLNVVSVKIPPLRERPEDLIEMIFLFLARINQKYNFHKVLSASVIEQLLAYKWPGNVRELENVLERMAITSDSAVIHPESLAEVLSTNHAETNPEAMEAAEEYLQSLINNPNYTLDEMMQAIERKILAHFMKELGSTRKMAKRLGVSQSTISRRLQKQDSKRVKNATNMHF
jgi:TyrR family helix-turn-helix protein/PAS domain S-box-containing protein